MEKHLVLEALSEHAAAAASAAAASATSVVAAEAPAGGNLPGTLAVAATAAVATVSLLALLRAALYPAGLRSRVFPSPLTSLIPRLSDQQRRELPYGPDAFPGARDVATPYGSVRAYEWGPEDGPRVLLIHGISTSCITLGQIAHGLVRRGCRVMLYDLFGRGFSDGVGDLPHDERLYVSQALIVLASSPLPWTGRGAMRIVGYSMGAAIAVHIAAAFPDMVAFLALVAPAGLIRASNFGPSRHMFRSGLVPEGLLAAMTRRRLRRPIAGGSRKAAESREGDSHPTVVDAAVAEVAEDGDRAEGQAGGWGEDGAEAEQVESRVRRYVRWMIDSHAGFVPAFMSCIRFAPLTDQQESWRALARRDSGTTAILLGRDDEIVSARQYREDALPLVGGEEHVRWRELPGGHHMVMTHPRAILAELDEFWGAPGA